MMLLLLLLVSPDTDTVTAERVRLSSELAAKSKQLLEARATIMELQSERQALIADRDAAQQRQHTAEHQARTVKDQVAQLRREAARMGTALNASRVREEHEKSARQAAERRVLEVSSVSLHPAHSSQAAAAPAVALPQHQQSRPRYANDVSGIDRVQADSTLGSMDFSTLLPADHSFSAHSTGVGAGVGVGSAGGGGAAAGSASGDIHAHSVRGDLDQGARTELLGMLRVSVASLRAVVSCLAVVCRGYRCDAMRYTSRCVLVLT